MHAKLIFKLFRLLGSTPTQKTYYVSLAITNQSPDDATISYLENGNLKEQDVPKNSVGSIMMSFTSSVMPKAIEFKAFKKGTVTVVKLNGTESLFVKPTESLVTVPVLIGAGK